MYIAYMYVSVCVKWDNAMIEQDKEWDRQWESCFVFGQEEGLLSQHGF